MFSRLLADVVLLLHLAYVLFAVLGGVPVLRRRAMAAVHPAASWRRPLGRGAAGILLMLTAACAPAPADTLDVPPGFAITDVQVVDVARGGSVGTRTVLVQGDRIVAVESAAAIRLPEGVHRIDGRGRFLIPGLVDMHVHFYEEEQEGDLSLYLANGVTAIRNMNAATVPGIVTWRDEIARGARVGPVIYTTGPTIRALEDSAHVERLLREHRAAGYDYLKVYSDIPAALYARLARRAAAEGISVVGHVPVETGVAGAIAAGQRTLEHAEDLLQTHFRNRIDPTRLPELVTLLAGSGTCVVPTLVVFSNVVRHFEEFPHLEGLMARPELRYVGPRTRDLWSPEHNSYVRRGRAREDRMPAAARAVREQYTFMKRIVAALDSAGVPLLAGSDANIPHTVPGFSLLDELEILVEEVGLTPAAALRAATLAPAECMGRSGEFGAIRPGMRADLVLLEANPLDDIRNVRRRVGVAAQGRWLTETELRRRMQERTGR